MSSNVNYHLFGGFNSSEKYESPLGWLFPIYGKEKMFQSPPSRCMWGSDYTWWVSCWKKTGSCELSWFPHLSIHEKGSVRAQDRKTARLLWLGLVPTDRRPSARTCRWYCEVNPTVGGFIAFQKIMDPSWWILEMISCYIYIIYIYGWYMDNIWIIYG